MRRAVVGLGVALVLAARFTAAQTSNPPAGITLSDLSWVEAESALTPSAVVVIPLGAATLEHGPHLKLNNDERLARYLASRVQTVASVVVAPPVTYHFNPAFLEYPGTTSLTRTTARDTIVEIVRSVGRYGPRRFYVLNTAGSATPPLQDAVDVLSNEGILLGYTSQTGTSHADANETSMMLFVDPSAVDMKKAVRELGEGSGPMTRQKGGPGVFSASGVLGDPTVATRENGQQLVEQLVARAVGDIEKLRRAPLPQARPGGPTPRHPRRAGRDAARHCSQTAARPATSARFVRWERDSASCGVRWTPKASRCCSQEAETSGIPMERSNVGRTSFLRIVASCSHAANIEDRCIRYI